MQFRCGHAQTNSEWEEAAQSCLMQVGELTDSANLGFLYVTDWLAGQVPDILDYLRRHTTVSQWVGTVGIGICGQRTEYFDAPAIAIMLGDFPENSFKLFTNITKDWEDFTRNNQSWCEIKRPMFAIVHGDPRNNQMVNLIVQLSERLGEGFLVGGLTSSRNQYFQIANSVSEGGLSGVMFASAVDVFTQLTQGCSAIGPRHQITECSNNIIIRIDGRPALDVFKEDIGKELASNLEKVAGHIFTALPVVGSDTGDYLVRNLLGIDPEHKLLAIGDMVSPGMPIIFTRREAQVAQKDLIKMLTTVKTRLAGRKPKGGVYHSCVGRGEKLFGKDKELQTIYEILGDFPLIGFFASGEIYHQRLYGYTGVLTVFL
jgi:small ligand-binding sensory domain FIST